MIDRIYSSKEGIDLSEFDFKDLVHPNECFVLKSDRNSVLARYNPFTHSIIRVMKGKNYGIEPRNAEQSFAFERQLAVWMQARIASAKGPAAQEKQEQVRHCWLWLLLWAS